MLDSPYVRRVAISLHSLNLAFEHLPLSVFRNMGEFSEINPLIKAPTLVCDTGEVLMDSTLILSYIDKLAESPEDNPADSTQDNPLDNLLDSPVDNLLDSPGSNSMSKTQPLMPQTISDYASALRLIGLGLHACDKTVQLIYEKDLRPVDKQHQPWKDRVLTQLTAAYDALEASAAETSDWLVGSKLTQADITACVAWQFTLFAMPDVIAAGRYPALAALSRRAEALSAFRQAPLEENWQPAK